MGSNNQESMKLKNEVLLSAWLESGRNRKKFFNWMVDKVKKKMGEDGKATMKRKTDNFCREAHRKWHQNGRSLAKLKKNNTKWLAAETSFVETIKDRKECVVGRRRCSYNTARDRTKRKLASELSSQQNNTQLLVHAATMTARNSDKADLRYVLNETMASPARPSKMRKILTCKPNIPKPLSPIEGLVFFIENGLTKQQYSNMRLLNKQRNSDIYPAYNKLRECKLECRPHGIIYTETSAQVSMQNLLNHTAKRILSLQKEVLDQFTGIIETKLIVSYGFDGSSGQSMFKQTFNDETFTCLDSALFVTSVIPLKLVTNDNKIIWLNRTTQSIRFCRPLKIEFARESKEHILAEKNKLDLEISKLIPFEWTIDKNKKVVISYDLNMTLIDGKVLNILTGTKSSQSCPICGATPKQFQSTTDMTSKIFQPKPSALKFGVSPLHAWIRLFKFVVHLSYRMYIKKWQIRTQEDKTIFTKRKHDLQNKFWQQMGLHVDKPKTNGSGTTNDGNTARRAFSSIEIFASITNVDADFLRHLYIILVVISCEYQTNIKKFDEYCKTIANLYFKTYDWYPMSATLHKILVHSSQIIEASIVPVGCLGENASEARNKFYKKDRIAHARKSSRLNNMSDVYNRAMDSSDPLLSSISFTEREKNRHKMKLPKEAIALLHIPDAVIDSESSASPKRTSEDEHSDSEDEMEDLPEYSFDLEADEADE